MSVNPVLYEETLVAPLQGLVSVSLLTCWITETHYKMSLCFCSYVDYSSPSPKTPERLENTCLGFLCDQVYNLTAFLMAWDRGHMSGCAIWSRSFAHLSATLTSCFPQWNLTVTVVIFHYYWSLNSRLFHFCLTVKLASMVSERSVEGYLIIPSNSLEVNLNRYQNRNLHSFWLKSPDVFMLSFHISHMQINNSF